MIFHTTPSAEPPVAATPVRSARAAVAAIVAALATAGAAAHDLWLEPSDGGWTLLQGHRHSGHEGADTVPYGAGFVGAARCLDADRRELKLAVASAAPWRARGDCAALVLDVSSGYWSKTPWETKNVPRSQAPGAVRSWLSRDRIKLIERWSPAFAQPLAGGLELMPTTDPTALSPGDKLVVRVVRDGRPLAGVPVAYHGDTRGQTDADGRIAIRLRHPGLQLISTSVETPVGDGQADVEIAGATLQFALRR